jgi:PEP-CTERM motif-containing protein
MRQINRIVLVGLLVLIGSRQGFATNIDVLAGSDYLTTQPGTVFEGVPFNGVPTGPGSTDTIVERLGNVNLGTGFPNSGTTPLLMTQLELVSAVPTNFGLGVGFYYITLQSARGGPATTGTMTINLTANDDNAPSTPEGTFSSFFDVFFDVRLGSASGPIALSSDLLLTNGGTPWDANPTPADLLVPGLKGDVAANFHTNKIQNVDIHDMDFFPIGPIIETNGTDTHVVTNTQIPEPGTLALLALAFAGLGLARKRKVN